MQSPPLCQGKSLPPSALRSRFLERKGAVAVDHGTQGIEMRWSRESHRKFTVHDVDETEFEVARWF